MLREVNKQKERGWHLNATWEASHDAPVYNVTDAPERKRERGKSTSGLFQHSSRRMSSHARLLLIWASLGFGLRRTAEGATSQSQPIQGRASFTWPREGGAAMRGARIHVIPLQRIDWLGGGPHGNKILPWIRVLAKPIPRQINSFYEFKVNLKKKKVWIYIWTL